MRHFLLLLLLSCTSLFSFGQQKDAPEPDALAFEEALDYYYVKEYDSALVLLEKFLLRFPSSPLVPRVKYNIGYLFVETERPDAAIPIFENLLKAKYNEKEAFGGIMEEYTLYKHRSAKHLAAIYLDKGDYKKAAAHIRLFDKKYKYQHFCGNELTANSIETAYYYARLYEGQGARKKAIAKLLPHTFYTGLASNEYVVNYLDTLLRQAYSEEQLKQFAQEAKASLRTSRRGDASIRWLGTKIQLTEEALFRPGQPVTEALFNLRGEEVFNRIIETHPLFSRHLTN